jgi:hypothetical protein
MNTNNLKVLQLHEIEPPALLAEALTDELFIKLKMSRIPVQIQSILGNRTHGYCSNIEYTERGEIVMSSELFDVRSERLRSRQIEEIINVYIHECAHRLCTQKNDSHHNAEFLCLNMILHLRAGDRQIWHVNVYDAHQEEHFAQAWQWAWELATKLYETDNSAEECAKIVANEYKVWAGQMNQSNEALLEAAKNRKKVEAAKQKKIENQIENLKQDRVMYSLIFSLLTFTITFFLTKQ